MNKSIYLVTEHYIDSSPERQDELIECLRRNLACQALDRVHLLGTKDAVEQLPEDVRLNEKLRQVQIDGRLTFEAAFKHANDLGNQIAIIANSDIYFDRTLEEIHAVDLLKNAMSLSRWDIQTDGTAKHYNNPWSFDSWIFQSPLQPANADFYFGIPGCDNRIAYEIQSADREVINPSLSIKTYHLHKTEKRNYVRRRDKVPSPYLTVQATTLTDVGSRKMHVFW